MLQLKNIKKFYESGDTQVTALAGVSIDFRESEFVSILGPSGCGKTTLLNIVGGLDRYSDGDLFINGRSTKDFKDSDWDTYRNHSVGFVFQSYHLIPHQSVLRNVELALTLSGVSKAERRRRATEALERVGLGDQLHKRPNQMSGGQMQRVAIARAIVNDPDILLADEPTGALDTQTSIQIMEILKEIAKDKLVIMVTHNPELAEEYSTRVVKLRDGQLIDDSMPFVAPTSQQEIVRKSSVKKEKKASMSFFTALSLSLNNLMTKKGRTFMTSFAGSIGIIGIALILALSNGVNTYIALVQEDTLSTYPLTVYAQTQDYSAMMEAMNATDDKEDYRDSGMIYVDDSMGSMMANMNQIQKNDLETFKKHIDAHYDELAPYLSALQYTYDFDLQVYSINEIEGGNRLTQVNPTTIFDNMGDAFSGMGTLMSMSGYDLSVMSEMIDNQELLNQQYDVVAGDWPTEANELVLVISKNNQVSKMTLYMLGVLDQSEIADIMKDLMADGSNYDSTPMEPMAYEDFVGKTFYLLNTSDYFEETDKTYTVDGKTYPIWRDKRVELNIDDEKKMQFVTDNGVELKISGIVRPAEGATSTSISTSLGYTKGLTEYILAQNTESEIINQQKETPEYNVLTGLEFARTEYTAENIDKLIATIEPSKMDALYSFMTGQIRENFAKNPPVTKDTFTFMIGIMTPEERTALLDSMLAVLATNPYGDMILSGVCGQLSDETLTVTPQNLKRVFPVLDKVAEMTIPGTETTVQMPQYMILFYGLQNVLGDEAMEPIYAGMNESIAQMEVNASNFTQLISMIAGDEASFDRLVDTLYAMAPNTDATYESTLLDLGDAEQAKPASINFYAIDFAAKDKIEAFIQDYNDNLATKYLDEYKPGWRDTTTLDSETVESGSESGSESEIQANREAELAKQYEIKPTDLVGMLLSSITLIINAISYVLIAFVSISLVVSSIMIGIITYISVLERTKEIGILRAMGASKRDIARVFNAETLIIGLCAGLIGIVFTVLICIPISLIVQIATDIPTIAAVLPWTGAVVLVIISALLTVIAGLIPSRVAAKKDPVVALRSE